MANTYLPDETKALLDKVAARDCRTLSDEMHFLCEQRLKLLDALEPKLEKPK